VITKIQDFGARSRSGRGGARLQIGVLCLVDFFIWFFPCFLRFIPTTPTLQSQPVIYSFRFSATPTLFSLAPSDPDIWTNLFASHRTAMSWISWAASLVPTFLVLLATLAWWHTQPKSALVNLIPFGSALFFYLTIAPEFVHDLCLSAYMVYANLVAALSLDLLVAKHANMLLTGAAVVWYVTWLRRTEPILFSNVQTQRNR